MERLVLDPSAVAVNRTEWDITQYVGEAGPDWGDAAIEQALADADLGALPVSSRVPPRTVTIPLLLLASRTGTPYTFEQVRQRFEQKVALFQREGGTIARSTSIGTVYADVTGATLKLGGSTAQALWGIDADAVLTLTCLPDWYADEITTPVITGSINRPNMIVIGGDYDKTALGFAPDLHWVLDANAGRFDQSGHSRDAVLVGSIAVGTVPGPFLPSSTATDFDGVNDQLRSNFQPFVNGAEFSVCGWAKRDSNGAVHTLFGSDAVPQDLQVKTACRVASTGNLALPGPTSSYSIDGVALANNDRVLAKNQTSSPTNGIYIFQTGIGLSRADDMDSAEEFPRAYVQITAGTTNAGTGWICTNDDTMVLGTTGVTWVSFSGTGSYVQLALAAGSDTVTFTSNSGGTTATWSNAWKGTGVWVHWAFTWKSATNRCRLYINGVVMADGIITANSFSLAGAFAVGARSNPAANVLDGAMRSVSFYPRTLSLAEVNSLYAVGAGGNVPVAGNYPARVRAIVTENSGVAQNGLLWSIRGRNYSPAGSAAPVYDAGFLSARDQAVNDGLTIQHTSLPTAWTPVASTDLRDPNLAPLGSMTHVGTYRVWLLVSGGVGVKLRLVWDVGDIIAPVENPPWTIPNSSNDYLVDLGIVRLSRPPVGPHIWTGIIQAAATGSARSVELQRIYFQNVDDYAGVLTANPTAEQISDFAARDEFRQANGNLNGVTADFGGAWATSGETTDFAISSGSLVRSAATDTGAGRTALLGPALAATSVQTDLKVSALTGSTGGYGVVARSSGSNLVRAVVASYANLITLSCSDGTSTPSLNIPFTFLANVNYTLQLVVGTTGVATVWCWQTGGAKGGPLGSIVSTGLATGGAAAIGKAGLFDLGTAGAPTRTYDNFLAWSAETDAVLYANRRAELRTDGMYREAIDSTYFGPVGKVVGDLPRLPVAGLEQRPVEITVGNSYGDFKNLPHRPYHSTIPTTKLQVIYCPCYLFVPEG